MFTLLVFKIHKFHRKLHLRDEEKLCVLSPVLLQCFRVEIDSYLRPAWLQKSVAVHSRHHNA